jgi:murein DD-endopeptidase MepM/ murein hydrolase activator NlpD
MPAPKQLPDWAKPAFGPVSSTFGIRWGVPHKGIDIAAPMGSKVQAARAGVVEKAGWYGGYGYIVIINHGNGMTTRYGHNSVLSVSEGERVEAGDKIAEIGSTGDSTGPHCHFEIRFDDEAVDPLAYFEENGIDVLGSDVNTSY